MNREGSEIQAFLNHHVSWFLVVGGAYALRLSIAVFSSGWDGGLFLQITRNYWLKGYLPGAGVLLIGQILVRALGLRRLRLTAYYSFWIGVLFERLQHRSREKDSLLSGAADWILARLFDVDEAELIAASTNPVPYDYSFWSRMQGRPQQKPSVVRRSHLTDGSFWPNWAFAEVLVFNDLALSCQQERGSRTIELEVDLRDQDLGIYNNAGKQFLQDHFLTERRRDRLARQSEEISAFISRGVPGDELLIDTADAPFRWASAGVLPVVHWNGQWWYVLYFRGVPPVGWNLAVGGSESESEYLDLYTLTLREFCEETVLLDRTPEVDDPHDVRQKTFRVEDRLFEELPEEYRRQVLGEGFSERHRQLRHAQDDLHIETTKGPALRTISTPFSVEIQTEETTRHVSDVIFSINPHEFGIEVISPYAFEMESDDVLMFGEVWEAGACPLRQPILLLSRDYVEARFEHSDGLGKPLDEYPYLDCRRLDRIPAEAYHLFDRDIDFRQRRVRMLQRRDHLSDTEQEELSLHTGWFDSFGTMFDEIRAPDAAIESDRHKPAATLCPVTWKTLTSAYTHDVHPAKFGSSERIPD